MSGYDQEPRKQDGPRFQLVLRSLPSGYPAIARLKRALKCLLRTFEFRCVECVQLHDDPPSDVPVDPPGNGPPSSETGATVSDLDLG
jgi:hypothetical protein